MYFALLFIFADAYLGLGPYIALVYSVSFVLGMVSLRLWFLLANRWGKQRTWMLGMVLVIIGTIGTGLLSPEHTGWIELLLCKTLVACGFAAFNMMVPSLLSDIIDYGTWKFGTDRAATYFSLYTFINKTVGALGLSLGLGIAGWAGFDATAVVQDDASIVGLRLGIAWIPAALIVLSIIFIIRIPITAHRHGIIRHRLNSRLARTARAIETPVQSSMKAEAKSGVGISSTTKNSDRSPPLLNT